MRKTFSGLFANVRLVQRLLITAAVLFPAATLFGQEPTNQPAQRAFDRLIENSVGAVLHPEASTALTTCGVTGTLSFGVSASGFLGGSNSCYDAPSGFWADFWTFSGSAGQRVRLAFTSSFSALATIQDYSTGTVLASSSSCGLARSCSFEYTLLNSSQYVVGLGAYSTGSYTLTLSSVSGSPPGSCTANATTLCLNNGRFRVQATYTTPAGQTGPGMAVPQTSDTGLFWFFSANNIEAIIKVVNACTFAGAPRYWVFAGGLTNVQVILTVTDTSNGTTRTYTNPQNTAFQPIQDTAAFATCP